MPSRSVFGRSAAALAASAMLSAAALGVDVPPEGSAITYGGEIKLSGAPINGLIDLRFQVYDAEEGGNRIGGLRTKRNVPLANGRFSTSVNFGATIYSRSDEAKWVEVQIRNPAGSGLFQTIRPRQAITVTALGVYQISGTPGPVGPAGAPGPAGASPFSLIGSNAVFLGGAVGIGSTMPMATLELGGGDDGNASTAISQLSLGYAYGGGFRHFIRSRHSGVASGMNSIDFFLNNQADGTMSMAPGIGNVAAFSLNAAGQGSFGALAIPAATELQVRSQGANNADFLIRPGNASFGYNLGTDGNKLFIARSDGSTYGDQVIVDGVNGRVGFGTTTPQIRIDAADGSTIGSVSGNQHVAGNRGTKVSFGYAPSNNPSEFAGMRAVVATSTGGCGSTGNTADLRFFTWECNTSVSREVVRFNGSGQTVNLTGTWSVFSDARLKHDIQPLEGALDRVLELRGRTFSYNKPGELGQAPGLRTGFVAQEVENVFPEWVGESDGYKTLTISGFEALTVESLRELRAEKDAQIAELKSENADLRDRLAALEEAVARLAK